MSRHWRGSGCGRFGPGPGGSYGGAGAGPGGRNHPGGRHGRDRRAPNAGKSTLLNALARREAAIVSPLPGTTRDAIEVHLDIGGFAFVLIDTAGLRETADLIERIGVARARARAEAADLILWLSETGAPSPADLPVDVPVWPLRSKSDLDGGAAPGFLAISAETGANLDLLTEKLAGFARAAAGRRNPASSPVSGIVAPSWRPLLRLIGRSQVSAVR